MMRVTSLWAEPLQKKTTMTIVRVCTQPLKEEIVLPVILKNNTRHDQHCLKSNVKRKKKNKK